MSASPARAHGVSPTRTLFSRIAATTDGFSSRIDLFQTRLSLAPQLPCGASFDLVPLAFRTLVGGVSCGLAGTSGVSFLFGGGPILGWTRYGRPLRGGWAEVGIEVGLGLPGTATLPLPPRDTMLLRANFRSLVHSDRNLGAQPPPDDSTMERAFALWTLWESSLDVSVAFPLGERDAFQVQARQTLPPILRRFGYAGRSSAMQFRHLDAQWRTSWELAQGQLIAGAGFGHLVAEIEALQVHTVLPSAHLSFTWN